MKKFSIVLLSLCTTSVMALDAENGKEMFDSANCMECHIQVHFTGEKRKATTYAQLDQHVEACRVAHGADWFDEDKDDVVHYLNETYYKHKK